MTYHTLKAVEGKLKCVSCGGVNGDMPTHCPVEWMDDDIAEDVSTGGRDYINGRGWVWLKARLEFNRRRHAARAEYREVVEFEEAVSAL